MGTNTIRILFVKNAGICFPAVFSLNTQQNLRAITVWIALIKLSDVSKYA